MRLRSTYAHRELIWGETRSSSRLFSSEIPESDREICFEVLVSSLAKMLALAKQGSIRSRSPSRNVEMKDFFVSYNRADRPWAEWIAWTLEEGGYSVVIQAWDFRPGGNFILDMHRATAETQKTIAVLSQTYLASAYTQPEWAAAFANDPQSLERNLIPVRVKDCQPSGMLRPLVYVDLVGVPEAEAKQRLLNSLKSRVKPEVKPEFPGDVPTVETTPPSPVTFPASAISSTPSATERLKTRKIQTLEQRIKALEENWDALSTQLNYTSNAADQKKLERQMATVEADMTTVAEQLDSLRN